MAHFYLVKRKISLFVRLWCVRSIATIARPPWECVNIHWSAKTYKNRCIQNRRRWMRPLPSLTTFHMKRNPIRRMHTDTFRVNVNEKQNTKQIQKKWKVLEVSYYEFKMTANMQLKNSFRMPNERRRHNKRQYLGITLFGRLNFLFCLPAADEEIVCFCTTIASSRNVCVHRNRIRSITSKAAKAKANSNRKLYLVRNFSEAQTFDGGAWKR